MSVLHSSTDILYESDVRKFHLFNYSSTDILYESDMRKFHLFNY